MNKIEFALRLAKDCTYADEMTEGVKEHLRKKIDEAIEELIRMKTDKIILDACCGGRMFWYNKENKDVLFMDKRKVEKGAFQNNWNPNWCVNPDVIADFRNMPHRIYTMVA